MTPHFMLIQACYSDPELSRRRLNISLHTSVAALSYQTAKPTIHIVQHPDDPHAGRREALYCRTGCRVVTLPRDEWRLYGENWELPDGRKIISRIDDDDVIGRDFCSRTAKASPAEGNAALIWPAGYVLWRERAYLLKHPGNQFVSLVTNEQHDPHQQGHWLYHKEWRTVVVSRSPGWMWVRHGDAVTPTLAKYRRTVLRGIDSRRMPINIRAIVRAAKESGPGLSEYAKAPS